MNQMETEIKFDENIESSSLSDTVIFVSNAELDGFREGDGDLMDKITFSLNNAYGIQAIRIIMNNLNVPSDKIELLEKQQLHPLFFINKSENEKETVEEGANTKTEHVSRKEQQQQLLKEAQEKFLEFVTDKKFDGKKKIVYIGSRINIKDTGLLGESGSLFDEEFIKTLKSNGIQIAVCCLEYKFFKRAVKHMQKAYEMMKQQLFLADKIHFMTQPDKDDFLLTMKHLSENPEFHPLKEALENYQNINIQLDQLFSNLQEVKKQKKLFTSKGTAIKKDLELENSQIKLQLATHEKALLLLPSDNEKINIQISELELMKSQELNTDKSQESIQLTENTKSKSSEEEDEFMFSFPEETQEKEKIDIDSEIIKLQKRKEENIEKIEQSQIAIVKLIDLLQENESKSLKYKKVYDNELILWERKEKAIEEKMKLLKLPLSYQFEGLQRELFDNLESKCCCIPGIYTVNPLSLKELMTSSEYEEYKALQILAERPCNILQFGMIRGEKGVDEAIDLALKLKEMQKPNKVIIAGKLMLDIGMVKNIFCRIFDMDSEEFYKHLNDALQNSKITEEILKPKEIRNPTIIQNLITSEKVHEKFNDFCMKLYKQLAEEKKECVSNIDIHFNVTEEKLRELAMQCKYAMKLDHKGLAHNASTIVSCFGFYLPVFTTCGLCTNDEFLSFELSNKKLENLYSGVAIMPFPQFTSNNDFLEVRPINPSTEQIIDFILDEEKHPEKYMEKLIALNKLYKDKIYNCDNVTKLLLKEVFIPLSQSQTLTNQFTNTF